MTPLLPDLGRLLAMWRGYGYGPLDHDARQVDCTAFVASILRDAWGPGVVTSEVWEHVNLSRPEHVRRPWAGVEAVAEAVGELPVHPHTGPYQPRPGRLHYCQGWRHLTTEGVGPGSRGHAWLWLSFGGWLGVCIESSGNGPRVWDGHGRRPLGGVVTSDGSIGEMQPLDWSARAEKWTSGVAYVVLP
jgi:hypothetical protein